MNGFDMKWKDGVRIEKNKAVCICLENRKKEMPGEDMLIIGLMEEGVTDDEKLVREVAKRSDHNEISAGLRLSQFVVDYCDFLAPAKPSEIYE